LAKIVFSFSNVSCVDVLKKMPQSIWNIYGVAKAERVEL
jgi:hypothetical protein